MVVSLFAARYYTSIISILAKICNSYSTVARDLSLKTIPRPRAQPEGERLFSTINPMATVL